MVVAKSESDPLWLGYSGDVAAAEFCLSGKMDSKEESEKLKRYEAEYANYLKSKYFSHQNIYGGEIFEEKATIDGMTIRAGSEPGTKSYADPLAFWNEKFGNRKLETETTTNLSNGKHSVKKSS
uniref:uncharacterized protein LOC122589207 n=1 Tax=Erigeron canadensis TaxID=72917 RepID=UPI001CB8A128|nr:uncharacterized protein LOC122589207 [Erigeron canadensis]